MCFWECMVYGTWIVMWKLCLSFATTGALPSPVISFAIKYNNNFERCRAAADTSNLSITVVKIEDSWYVESAIASSIGHGNLDGITLHIPLGQSSETEVWIISTRLFWETLHLQFLLVVRVLVIVIRMHLPPLVILSSILFAPLLRVNGLQCMMVMMEYHLRW